MPKKRGTAMITSSPSTFLNLGSLRGNEGDLAMCSAAKGTLCHLVFPLICESARWEKGIRGPIALPHFATLTFTPKQPFNVMTLFMRSPRTRPFDSSHLKLFVENVIYGDLADYFKTFGRFFNRVENDYKYLCHLGS